MRRSTLRILIASTAALPALAGCAQAEKTRYRDHVQMTMAAGAPSNDDLAIAFGLDVRVAPPATMAAVEP